VDAIFRETSALTGVNIQDMFTELLKMMSKDAARTPPPANSSV